jgi:hypothetical protein
VYLHILVSIFSYALTLRCSAEDSDNARHLTRRRVLHLTDGHRFRPAVQRLEVQRCKDFTSYATPGCFEYLRTHLGFRLRTARDLLRRGESRGPS